MRDKSWSQYYYGYYDPLLVLPCRGHAASSTNAAALRGATEAKDEAQRPFNEHVAKHAPEEVQEAVAG